MKIQIENNLYLESDERQFILKEYSGKQSIDKHGVATESFKTIGYYTDVRAAINKLVQMKVMESTAQTLGELLAEFESIRAYIESKVTV